MKPEYHYKYPKVSDFADMLVDLCEYCRPRLCICDAVVGMEGNGPTQGSARSIGCLIAAQSAHKLDLAACGLIGLMPSEVPTLSAAIRRGLCPDSAEKLTIFGEPAAFAVPDYKTVPSQASVFFRSGAKGGFRQACRQLPVPYAYAVPQASRKRLRRLQKMRQYLSGQSHHNARRQAGY